MRSYCSCLMFGDLLPSMMLKIISITTSSSLPSSLATSSDTHFLMTGRLTLPMSTFRWNSGGYLVVRIALASADVLSAADILKAVSCLCCEDVGVVVKSTIGKVDIGAFCHR